MSLERNEPTLWHGRWLSVSIHWSPYVGARIETTGNFHMTYPNSKDFCTTLDSSVVKTAAYTTNETLEVEFRTGAVPLLRRSLYCV